MHIKDTQFETDVPSAIDQKNPQYCLNANLRKACRIIMSFYADAMRDSKLQGTQFTLLSTISGFGEVTIGELSAYLVMDQTTVTRNVNLLKKASHVEVKQGEDRRTRIIRLTEQGQAILDETYPLWRKAQTQAWEELGNDTAHQLLMLSEQIVTLDKAIPRK